MTPDTSSADYRIPIQPPAIPPLAPDDARPLWSVMIPVYNSIYFFKECLESVLTDALPENQMQIEVIDDASTDGNIESIIRSITQRKVEYFRQPSNVGSLRNFETCINRSRGKIVHILHADDKVYSGFYKTLGNLFEKYPECGAAFCRYDYINEKGEVFKKQGAEMTEEGILPSWLYTIAKSNRIQFPAIAVKRMVYEKTGSFYAMNYAEDWEMWVRIARDYPVAYTPEIHAAYRKHVNSITGDKIATGEYVTDLNNAITLIQAHLPETHKKATMAFSKKYYAEYAISMAESIWKKYGPKSSVRASLREAGKHFDTSPLTWKILKLKTKMLLNVR